MDSKTSLLFSQRLLNNPKMIRRHAGWVNDPIEFIAAMNVAMKYLIDPVMMEDSTVKGDGFKLELLMHSIDLFELKLDIDKDSWEKYRTYCIPPYETQLFESPEYDSKLIQYNQKSNKVSILSLHGVHDEIMYKVVLDLNTAFETENVIRASFAVHPSFKANLTKPGSFTSSEMVYLQDKANAAARSVFKTLHLLLFINARNFKTAEYKCTKKDSPKAAKPILDKYVYRILNIRQEKKTYTSLKATLEDLMNPVDKVERRAHFVTGHFKRIKGKLYWWNLFLRNAKNVDTVGFVDKEYHVKPS